MVIYKQYHLWPNKNRTNNPHLLGAGWAVPNSVMRVASCIFLADWLRGLYSFYAAFAQIKIYCGTGRKMELRD